jgi:glycosyltransferase involved in cell wall biosynthesis
MKNIVPIKMYEYMACGKPVISTRLPGIVKEFGVDNGVIYVSQPTEVFEQVIRLSSNSQDLAEYGSLSRRFVQRRSWNRITDEFETILKNIEPSSGA